MNAEWNEYDEEADVLIVQQMPDSPFVVTHLRQMPATSEQRPLEFA